MIDEYSALLSAIRETQLDHGQQLNVIEGKIDKLDRMDEKLGRLDGIEEKLDRLLNK